MDISLSGVMSLGEITLLPFAVPSFLGTETSPCRPPLLAGLFLTI